jgi:alginate biosynthesis protein AlgX
MNRLVKVLGVFTCLLVLPYAFIYAQEAQAETPSFTCEEIENHETTPVVQDLNGWLFGRSEFDIVTKSEVALPYLQRFYQALQSQGIIPVVVVIPRRPMVYYQNFDLSKSRFADYSVTDAHAEYANFLKTFTTAGFLAPDLLSVALEAVNDSEPLYFAHDHHWTPAGAKLYARPVAEAIKTMSEYSALEKTKFETTFEGTGSMPGSWADLVRETCGVDIPNEDFPKPVTKVAEGDSEVELLSDTPAPQIILVGTSQSFAERGFNFDGYLSEFLEVEVVNYALPASFWAGIQSYFLSESYTLSKPKFLIWEFGHFPIGAPVHYLELRQIIPSVYGACSQEDSLASNHINVTNQDIDLMSNLGDSSIQGSDYFVYFEASDVSMVEFDLKIAYSDATVDEIHVERSTRGQNLGRFFMEFSNEIKANIQGIKLHTSEGASGTIDARICKIPH